MLSNVEAKAKDMIDSMGISLCAIYQTDNTGAESDQDPRGSRRYH
jgi:hypothetical protein